MANKSNKKSIDSFFQENVAFFVCLLFSIVVWIAIKMSEEYTVRDKFDINYKIESAYDFTNNPLQTIDFDKTGTGWALIKSSTPVLDKNVTIETIPEIHSQLIQRSELTQLISRKINTPNIKVDNLSVDAVYLQYEKRDTKRVPIKLIGTIKPTNGYIFTDDIILSPDHVVISGATSVLDTIAFWPTQSIGDIHIKEPFEQSHPLSLENHINLDINSISIKADVEQITQKKLTVPIYTDNKNVQLLPAYVQVEFNTGISRFHSFNADQFSFKVRIDSTDNRSNKNAPVILEKYPRHIINVRFQPKVVEYLFN